MDNPFTISFGLKPIAYISRLADTNQIINTFSSDNPFTHTYIIMGVRGSGKTVLMANITKHLHDKNDWIIIRLNPEMNLLESLNAKLYHIKGIADRFSVQSFSVSAAGFASAEMQKQTPVLDVETSIEEALVKRKENKKKVLIAIDEISNTKMMREFAHTLQMLLSDELPVFLLMTGLFKNASDLQNNKNLTFLYRVPKIILEPLSLYDIRDTYKTVLELSDDQAREMAILTKGYPFAFQTLRYLYWESVDKDMKQIIYQYDKYLRDFVYEKLWSELSPLDQKLIREIAKSGGRINTELLRKNLNMDSKMVSVYKNRLKQQGIISYPARGEVVFVLPRFTEFVNDQMIFEGI